MVDGGLYERWIAAFCMSVGRPRSALRANLVRLGVMDHSVRGRACHFARDTPDDNSAEPKEFGRRGPEGAAGELDWALKLGPPSIPSGRSPSGGWTVCGGCALATFFFC